MPARTPTRARTRARTRPPVPVRVRGRDWQSGGCMPTDRGRPPRNPIPKPLSPRMSQFAGHEKPLLRGTFWGGMCPFAGVSGPTVIGPRESNGCMIHPASRTAGGRGRTGITSNRRATSPRAAERVGWVHGPLGQGHAVNNTHRAGVGKFERGSNHAARLRAGAWPATT